MHQSTDMSDAEGATAPERIYSVSEVTRRVKDLLESDPELRDVAVEGEITDFGSSGAGHMYFGLKDEDCVLNCVMFSGDNRHLGFEPEDGDEVVAEGRISVYEARGDYQLYVDGMERVGDGALWREYLERKEALREEGLFAEAAKQPIPSFPSTVGVVTSETGAALQDVRDVLDRRFPVDVTLAPSRVQGDGAAEEIARAVRRIDRTEAEVLIVGRGGGSLEDLWAFNEEVVARAIHAADTPVVSAVGHEVDETIADHVADERAATPSEAAELVVPSREEMVQRVDELAGRMESAVERTVGRRQERLESFARVLRGRPPGLDELAQHLEGLDERLRTSATSAVENRRAALESAADLLDSLSPLGVLDRGYAVATHGEGTLSSIDEVAEGDDLTVTVVDGDVDGRVTETRAVDREV